MEDFTSEFHKVLKPPPSLSELSFNINMLSNLSDQLNPLISSHNVLDYFSSDAFISHPDTSHQAPPPASVQVAYKSSFTSFDQNPSGSKRKRRTEGQGDKPKEVIHVRAKRGQATDSHSLAERVRRERINEKLKVLQDLVPGCYKTMGMSVMLEVIINYVRSLQNQIEFLSMKLSAASMFYDFNSPEAEAIEALQRTATAYEAQEAETLAREGYGVTLPRLHPTQPF